MNISTIVVPVSLAAVLSFIFQYLKPALENWVPGFRLTDASHDGALRAVYGALVFLAVGAYHIYTAGAPSTLDGWVTLIQALTATASTMGVAAHVNYRKFVAISTSTAAPVATTSTDPASPPGLSLASLQAQLAPAA